MPIKDRKDRKTGAEHHSKAPINVVYRKIAELTLDRFNPRIHTPRQVRQIAQSIDTFGFLVPVVIDGAGNTLLGMAAFWPPCFSVGPRFLPFAPTT